MPLNIGRHFCLVAINSPFGESFSYSAVVYTGWAILDCEMNPCYILLLYQLSISIENQKNPVDLKNQLSNIR